LNLSTQKINQKTSQIGQDAFKLKKSEEEIALAEKTFLKGGDHISVGDSVKSPSL